MKDSAVHRPHRESPAEARLAPFVAKGDFASFDAHRFEVVSRGDFVPGLLFLPPTLRDDATAPQAGAPLVLVQHGLGGSKSSPYLDCAARWVRDGFAVAAIDLPLHGERSSPKLSARLIDGIDRILRDEGLDAETFALVEEFARQSTSDLIRTIDALSELDTVDATRIGYVGFSLGAVVGSYLLAHDPRPSVAVLALAGAGRGPEPFDPGVQLSRERSEIAGANDAPSRGPALLVVAAEDDDRVTAESTRALFDAAQEPKEFLISPGDHGALSGKTLKRIQAFLQEGFAR